MDRLGIVVLALFAVFCSNRARREFCGAGFEEIGFLDIRADEIKLVSVTVFRLFDSRICNSCFPLSHWALASWTATRSSSTRLRLVGRPYRPFKRSSDCSLFNSIFFSSRNFRLTLDESEYGSEL